jgi:hypothetical protein
MWEPGLSEADTIQIYDDTPVWARMTGWLLLGVGAFVLLPLALFSWTWWLPIPAIPFIIIGGLLLQLDLQISAKRSTGTLRVTNQLFGLRLRERTYSLSDVHGLEVERVAGDEQVRASDTWYLSLYLPRRSYIIGRYDTRWDALREKDRLSRRMAVKPRAESAPEASE